MCSKAGDRGGGLSWNSPLCLPSTALQLQPDECRHLLNCSSLSLDVVFFSHVRPTSFPKIKHYFGLYTFFPLISSPLMYFSSYCMYPPIRNVPDQPLLLVSAVRHAHLLMCQLQNSIWSKKFPTIRRWESNIGQSTLNRMIWSKCCCLVKK